VKRELTIYTNSITLLDLPKQKKMIAEVMQKRELGNHNLFLCMKTKEREMSKAKT